MHTTMKRFLGRGSATELSDSSAAASEQQDQSTPDNQQLLQRLMNGPGNPGKPHETVRQSVFLRILVFFSEKVLKSIKK